MPMAGRVGAVCAANRRNRSKHTLSTCKTSIGRTYSAGVSAPKQIDVSESTSVDSKPSVMSLLKQQVQEKASFLKKQKQAFAEKVQKGFNMTSSKPSREQKHPSVPAANLPAVRMCPDGHTLEGSDVPREGGWCDGCRSSTELGQHMMSCRPCNYDICDACFCHAPAPRLLEDDLEDEELTRALAVSAAEERERQAQARSSGCFAPPARRSPKAACAAHQAEDSKPHGATPALFKESKLVVEAVAEDTKPVVEATVEAVVEAMPEGVIDTPVVEASAVLAKAAALGESTPVCEARVEIWGGKPALAAEAIAEQPDQTDEDSIQVLAAAVVASVSARVAKKLMMRQESILQQKHMVEEESLTKSPVRGGA